MTINNSETHNANFYKLFLFSFLIVIVTYGFALTNFTLSIDNEIPILPDFGLDGGRWGQNLIRYHLFKGHLQYFSLLLSLFLFSLAAVRLTKVFDLKGGLAYVFCALFLTFPEMAYQVVFSMMADVAALGVLLSVFCVELFLIGLETKKSSKKAIVFSTIVLLLAFTFSIYQALVIVPITIYLILFLKATFEDRFNLKLELKNIFFFGLVVFASAILYYFSVKIICPPMEGSYLSSYMSGKSENQLFNFWDILIKNLSGSYYYGERMFIIASLLSCSLFIGFIIKKKYAFVRLLALFFILLFTFLISYFITNGYHPPRLYVTSNLVFAFIIVFAINRYKIDSNILTKGAIALIAITNIYFVTHLFYTINKIYLHDKKIAERIDTIIQNKYPEFSTSAKTVYFYGYFPYEYHQKFRLDQSEVFGGSFYNWDNGNNYRIIHFFKEAAVADYTMIDTKEKYYSIKDSIDKMPIWPNYESVKMINKIVIVKLGQEKGMPISVE